MTQSGIEPATFRFVAQYLNHCATISGPHSSIYISKILLRRQIAELKYLCIVSKHCTTNKNTQMNDNEP
jgi:hypothetical protein